MLPSVFCRHITMSESKRTKICSFFQEDIHLKYSYILLFACCLTSGLVDSSIYNGKHILSLSINRRSLLTGVAYSTFVSMQTGNTIFVGLGAAGHSLLPHGWARSLTSIGCFVLGSFVFSRLSSTMGPRKRGTLVISFLFQAMILSLTASLIQGGVVAGITTKTAAGKAEWSQESAIVLLSFQSAGQIVASRALGFNEIPTVVITSLLCDLVSDEEFFALRNGTRDRRILAFCLTILGAIAGGWITKATGDIAPVLWLAAGIKLVIAGSWSVWKRDPTV